MIVVKLMGGIGNQMFQYATGKALASKYNVPLKLDHGFLEDRTPRENFTYRDYELFAFDIDARITKKELSLIGLNYSSEISGLFLNKLKRKLFNYKILNEKSFAFDPTLLENGGKVYLNGYFQTEKYFKQYQDIIRKDFTFIPTRIDENKEFISKINNSSNPVSLHIRRGDYLTLADGKFHNICPMSYYQEAVKIIKQNVENPTFFVFSADDPQWAKDNLDIDAPYEIIGERNVGKLGFENMRLMSLCKHNILANSSFSWWGAWLNPNPSKIVIAPQIWFNDPSYDTRDIIPDNWLRI